MTKNIFNYTISILILGLALVQPSCSFMKSQEPAENEEVLPEDIVELRDDQIKLAGIEFGTVRMQEMGDVLKVNGIVSVSPQNYATVCMPLGGFIKSTNLVPGNFVKKGETLAVVENQEFIDIQQSYLEAKNKLEYAKAEFDRHTDLFKEDVYSEKNLQQVTVEYRNLKALVKSLEQKLIMIGIDPSKLNESTISSSVNLLSPISGYLKAVDINVGKYVSSTDILFEIVNSDKLFLELTIFEKDAVKVATGQKVVFYINNEADEHEAVITQTGKSVTDDKTIKVFATVNSSCKNLLPGMYVNAMIHESGRDVSSLPSEAVVSFDDKDYIFVFEKDKEEAGRPFTEYRMIEVSKGITSGDYTEVIFPEGFAADKARIVVKGAYNLLSAKKNAGEMAC